MAEQSKIEAIKSLKERTGAGMMDCKRALEENDYDIEKAIDVLREKGIVKAAIPDFFVPAGARFSVIRLTGNLYP